MKKNRSTVRDTKERGKVPACIISFALLRTSAGYDLIKLKMVKTGPIQSELDKIKDTLKSGHRVWLASSLPASSMIEIPQYLPPAPHGGHGCYEAVYAFSWSSRTAYETQQCAARISEVPLELASPVNPRESLSLFVAEGWCPVISRNQAIATK